MHTDHMPWPHALIHDEVIINRHKSWHTCCCGFQKGLAKATSWIYPFPDSTSLDQDWNQHSSGPISCLSCEFGSGALNNWVRYVCRSESGWRETYTWLSMYSSHEEAERSQSVEEGGTRPQLQKGGCLGLWWFPYSGFICEARLHFISEIFLTSQRCKLATYQWNLAGELYGLTHHITVFDPTY